MHEEDEDRTEKDPVEEGPAEEEDLISEELTEEDPAEEAELTEEDLTEEGPAEEAELTEEGPAEEEELTEEGPAEDEPATESVSLTEAAEEPASSTEAFEGEPQTAFLSFGSSLPLSRRTLILGLVSFGVLAAGVGLVAACTSSLHARATGQLSSVAKDLVQKYMQSATSTADDVQLRASRGEGVVSGIVCIDAGHGGGYDGTQTPIGPGSSIMQSVEPGGTSGVVTRKTEAEVNLEIALLLRDKLNEVGITTVMVREDNTTIYSSEERARIANECGADIFIRLHCDGSESSSLRGFLTLVPGLNEWTAPIVESSAYAAQIMHPYIVERLGANDRGIVERTDLAGFNFCEVPAVLFEMGLMTNPEEDVLLSDPAYQDLLAQSICEATVLYLVSLE